jgi:hypothetical protein
VAGLLREQLNVEVGIKPGRFLEFTVLAGEQILTQGSSTGDREILEAVRGYLDSTAQDNGTKPE